MRKNPRRTHRCHREITEFYYRKGGRGLQVGVSARWNGSGEKKRILF
jgi:hypothetical protein